MIDLANATSGAVDQPPAPLDGLAPRLPAHVPALAARFPTRSLSGGRQRLTPHLSQQAHSQADRARAGNGISTGAPFASESLQPNLTSIISTGPARSPVGGAGLGLGYQNTNDLPADDPFPF